MLALNAAHVTQTSPLDLPALRDLVDRAWRVGLRGEGADAFLIALDDRAAYDNPNFAWFRSRYARFVYVDRVIVAPHARGGGVARGLYEELFEAARQSGRPVVGCEVNLEPPNPASDAFHERLGFVAVGRGELPGGKVVRYLARTLAPG